MHLLASDSSNGNREGEAPAEPLQSQPRNDTIAPSGMHGALSARSEPGPREGEAPAEPPQTQTRESKIAAPAMHGVLPTPQSTPEYPIRKRPAHGVLVPKEGPVIVYLTVCTKDREKWLTQRGVHKTLCRIWQRAQAWRVGRYVIMPDHLHLFAA